MKNVKILAFLFIAAFFTLNISYAAAATATQWFPSSGTTVDYNYSVLFTFTNGTTVNTNHFNVYGNAAGWYIEPVFLAQAGFNFTVPLLNSNVEIKMHHSYAELNSTYFNRTTSYMAGSNNTGKGTMAFIIYETNGSIMYFPYNSIDYHIEPKTGFQAYLYDDLIDYFDNSVVIGGLLATHFYVTSITSTSMILSYFSSTTNYTYVTDASGKVTSFSMEYYLGTKNIKSFEYLFEIQPPASTIALPVEWVIIGCLVGIISLVPVITTKSRKSGTR